MSLEEMKKPDGGNRQGFESANQTSKEGKPMTSLALNVNNANIPVTMTSLELVEFINSQRKDGEAVLRHDDFMRKVPKVLGEEAAPKFYGVDIFTNGTSTTSA